MIKKWLPIILVTICLCGSAFGISSAIVGQKHDTLHQMELELASLQNKVASKRVEREDENKTIIQSVTGFDQEKKDADDALIKEVFDVVFNWSTGAEYVQAREDVQELASMASGGSFLKVFMPELVIARSANGTEYNQIDEFGLNCKLLDFETFTTGTGAVRSYAAFVEWQAKDSTGATASHTDLVTYSVKDDQIVELRAFSVSV